MSYSHWQKAKQLFAQALDQPQGQRVEFLKEQAGQDNALFETVYQMLEAENIDNKEEVFQALSSQVESALKNIHAMSPGTQIGHYEIIEKIGEGGMGAIFLAKRSDQSYQQRVAIKLLHASLRTNETTARFQSERQILADLDHRNIARLLDGGETDEGIPYLVMEFIEGVPLMAFLQENAMSLNQRLGLFLQICDAVNYAHQHLITHSDLKPANIMVTAKRGVKLLDFGIAKIERSASEPAPTDDMLSQKAFVPHTPESSSPEQILQQQVTTRTDVYALGVLLFKMLSDVSPYRHHLADLEQLKKAILNLPTPLPSDCVSERKYQKQLQGDLDAIVSRAMQKNPADRYESVALLAEDVRCFMGAQPVSTMPASWLYLSRKFIARHTLGVIVSSLFALFVSVSAITMTIQAVTIAKERDIAEQEKTTAEQVSAFLLELFSNVDPNKTDGADLTASQLLENGERRLAEQLHDQPRIKARLLQEISHVYYQLGISDRSLENIKQAQLLRLQHFGEKDPDYLDGQNRLVSHLYHFGKTDESLVTLAKQNLDNVINWSEKPSAILASALLNVAHVSISSGKPQEALDNSLASLQMYRGLSGETHRGVSSNLTVISTAYFQTGNYQDAKSYAKEALDIAHRVYGEKDGHLIGATMNLAEILKVLGDNKEAEQMYLKGFALSQEIFPENSIHVIDSLNYLGMFYRHIGEYQNAQTFLTKAADKAKVAYDDNSWLKGYFISNAASLQAKNQDYDSAYASITQALAIYADIFKRPNAYELSARLLLGEVLNGLDRSEEALTHLQHNLELQQREYPDNLRMVTRYKSAIGEALSRLGNFQQAETLLTESITFLEENYPSDRYNIELAVQRMDEHQQRLGESGISTP